MENITPYDIAIIGGGFTVVGALIGAFITYRFSLKLAEKQFINSCALADRQELRIASAKFFAAFAPAVAQIYLARHHGTHDIPIVGNILKDALVSHASAIEEFRPFVSDGAAYQEAWEHYRKAVRQDNNDINTAEWGTDAPLWATVEAKIHAVLESAKSNTKCKGV